MYLHRTTAVLQILDTVVKQNHSSSSCCSILPRNNATKKKKGKNIPQKKKQCKKHVTQSSITPFPNHQPKKQSNLPLVRSSILLLKKKTQHQVCTPGYECTSSVLLQLCMTRHTIPSVVMGHFWSLPTGLGRVAGWFGMNSFRKKGTQHDANTV